MNKTHRRGLTLVLFAILAMLVFIFMSVAPAVEVIDTSGRLLLIIGVVGLITLWLE